MLGWMLLGALLGAAVIMIYVSYLDRSTAKKELKERNISKARIKEIITSSGTAHIKLNAIDEDGVEHEVEIAADDYNKSEIREGMTINA